MKEEEKKLKPEIIWDMVHIKILITFEWLLKHMIDS